MTSRTADPRVAEGAPPRPDGGAGTHHDHVFRQDEKRPGESRTAIVVAMTGITMLVEVTAGLAFGSMALLADGLHMASHTAALGVSLAAYVIARRLAADPRFSFGVGKINALAAFASAVMLLGFALVMAIESVERLISPVAIAFDSALVVAVFGLLVNGASAWILAAAPHTEGDGAHHGHTHGQAHGHHHDHNLRAAYLHVLADALTSFLAIGALLCGKYFDAGWLDPAMGIVGAALISRWSYGLLRDSARLLLDFQADAGTLERVRQAVENGGEDRVTDLHLWQIGPGLYAAELTVESAAREPPGFYRGRLPMDLGIVHATIEVTDPGATRRARH